MGKFTYSVLDGKTPMPQTFSEDCTRDEVIKDLQEYQRSFAAQSSNVYLLNGDIAVNMVGSAYGKPYTMNGVFTNAVSKPHTITFSDEIIDDGFMKILKSMEQTNSPMVFENVDGKQYHIQDGECINITHKIGTEEGERCNRDGCDGVLIEKKIGNGCYCFNMAPCGYCTSSARECPECGWDERDDDNYIKP